MLVDLHCHTTASDGTLSPDELLSRAIGNGVELLSITDHDTLAAYRDLAAPAELKLVAGIEFSCHWQKRGLHIVGLNVDLSSSAMAEAELHQHHARNRRAELIAEKLEKYGVESPLAGARSMAAGSVIGRPHFARYLTACEFVKTEEEAFKKYLGSGKPCDIKVCWPEPKQVIDWTRAAGGVAVLAHPAKYKLTNSGLRRFLEEFTNSGGQGMEVVSGQQTADKTRLFTLMCQAFNMYASLGSDFHSPAQHWLDLGRYASSQTISRPVWDLFR